MSKTGLRELQIEQGAQFSASKEFCGLPNDFGDPAVEYRASLDSVALIDVSDRTQIEITGADRAKFLHNFCTNDIRKLTPGDSCEAFLTNVKGRVIGHLFVYCSHNSLWIDSVPEANESILPHLERYIITEDVELHDRTDSYAQFLITGPKAIEVERPNSRSVGWFQNPSFLISVSNDDAMTLWRELSETESISQVGRTVFEQLRIENGLPHFGIDISDGNLAQEVDRNKQAISFTKGCYLGQEPIARLDAMGHVNRALRIVSSDEPPQVGAEVFADSSGESSLVGMISSVSSGESVGKSTSVSLAVLRSSAFTPGTELFIDGEDSRLVARVHWPVVSTE